MKPHVPIASLLKPKICGVMDHRGRDITVGYMVYWPYFKEAIRRESPRHFLFHSRFVRKKGFLAAQLKLEVRQTSIWHNGKYESDWVFFFTQYNAGRDYSPLWHAYLGFLLFCSAIIRFPLSQASGERWDIKQQQKWLNKSFFLENFGHYYRGSFMDFCSAVRYWEKHCVS